MAASEEISEKLAGILFEYLLRSANYVTDTVPNALGALGEMGDKTLTGVTKLAKGIVERTDSSRYLKMDGEINAAELNQAVKKLKTHARVMRIADTDHKDFEAMLHTEKILYAKIDMLDDNCKMFMYMDKDTDKVNTIVEALRAKRGISSEISPNLFIQSLQPDQVFTISNLSAVDLELFRHYAKESGILFTTVNRPDGYMLVMPLEDMEKAKRAMVNVGWALTGRNGARIREQVESRLKGRTAINISAEEAQRELVVVSRLRPDHFVQISSEDYRVYKANKQVATVSRSAENFHTRCLSACEALSEPVVMTTEEFESLTAEKLAKMTTFDLFPKDFDDQVEQNQQNRLRDLISQKMSLDNEGNTEIDITDPSITYSEFAQYEYLADDEEREAREFEFDHYKQAHAYGKQKFAFEQIDRDGRNLDFIISQAESRSRNARGEKQDPVHAPAEHSAKTQHGKEEDAVL